jgi:hypothetical protein
LPLVSNATTASGVKNNIHPSWRETRRLLHRVPFVYFDVTRLILVCACLPQRETFSK